MGDTQWKSSCQNLENEVEQLMKDHRLPHPIALYLAARGIESASVPEFLNPHLAGLSDPYRFPGIEKAVARLWQAVQNKEPILIHGDYDTDGITASVLLLLILQRNGAVVHSFIPHRFDDGYGFTPESLLKALDSYGPCKVLVTVDCGVTSCDAVKEANRLGIDVIITDHHEAASELPAAIALINAKIYPELSDLHVLSGAGAAFKLSHAFVKYGREHNLGGFNVPMEDVLDYVALGTVADIVPLQGENRTLVKYGIEILKKQLRPGIRALIESSKLRGDLTPADITFKLAPRINAAGRVGDAHIALQLLESENIVEAYRFANELESFNSVRQEKEQEIYQEARTKLESTKQLQENYALLVAGRNWHQGVIGIVASRIARDFNRPTIVLTIQGDHAYGSGRSVGTLNLVEMLSAAAPLLERYGGHPMAVGVGLETAKIEEFHLILEKEVRKHIRAEDIADYIEYDGETELNHLDDEFFNYLTKLAPFGHGNPKPVYRFNSLEVGKCYLIGKRHTRGEFSNRRGCKMEFIAFNHMPEEFAGQEFDVLATPQLNNYYNVERPQLNIVAIRRA